MEKSPAVSSSMQPRFLLIFYLLLSFYVLTNAVFQRLCLLMSQILSMEHLLHLAIASPNHQWCSKSSCSTCLPSIFFLSLYLISSPQQLSGSPSYRRSRTAPSAYHFSSRVSATRNSVSSWWGQAGGLFHSHTAAANTTFGTAAATAATAATTAAAVTVPRGSAYLKPAGHRSACWLPAVWYPCNDQHQLWKREYHPVSHLFVYSSFFLSSLSS